MASKGIVITEERMSESNLEVFAAFTDSKGHGPDVFKLEAEHWPRPEFAAMLTRPMPAFLIVLTPDDSPSGKASAAIGDGQFMLYAESAIELHRRLGEWIAKIGVGAAQRSTP